MHMLKHLYLNDNTPGLDSQIPAALGQLEGLLTLELTNNALNGELPAFLQEPYQEGRTVGITGNPYYCPLPLWALPSEETNSNGTFTGELSGGYIGIECLHCPGENYLTPSGRPDYTMTCSGHGVCIDGIACQCDAAWDGFSDDCSQLACPMMTITDANGVDSEVYCSGVADCYNPDPFPLNSTAVACDADGNPLVTPHPYLENPINFVGFYVDCETRMMTVAQCACQGITQAPPDCAPVQLKGDSLTVIDSPAPARVAPSRGTSVAIAAVLAASLRWLALR